MRYDGRSADQARQVTIQTDFMRTADGSCLIATGNTRVICTASVEETVPPFLKGKGQGWITAEYAMLPASTGQRKKRDGAKKDGRSVEIQRLIGRSLRQAVDMVKLGERTITIDCDVLEADGGTRTASITGGMVALTCAIDKLIREKKLLVSPIVHQVAAVSCGIIDDEPCLDLCYQEDSRAQVDMNVVMNEQGQFIELQGTGEGRAFSPEELAILTAYGKAGIDTLMQAQKVSRKAAAVGFEWETVQDVWDEVAEERAEFEAEAPGSPEREMEFGDLLFALVNVARKEGIDAESALRASTAKFRRRWAAMEQMAADAHVDLAELSTHGLNDLWDAAKAEE